jgi:hypothetical protein
MEDDKEIKQTYLRTEIMEKGFNTDEFVDFLLEKKGGEDGANVENWAMDDLKAAVEEFKKLKPENPTQSRRETVQSKRSTNSSNTTQARASM